MIKRVAFVAVLLCLAVWGETARAGAVSLTVDFNLQSVNIDIFSNQTTVTSALTATINAPPGATFSVTSFTNSDGFISPAPTGLLNPSMSPGVCTPPGVTFTCTLMGLDFMRPGIAPGGPFTFTANTVLQDGFTVPVSASFQASIPEPGALALLSLGLVGLGIVWRKSGRKPQ